MKPSMKTKLPQVDVCHPIMDAFQKQLIGQKNKNCELGNLLLEYLSQNVVFEDKVSGLWIFELLVGINKALEERTPFELSEAKYNFLYQLIMSNKIKQLGSYEVVDYWLPYIWSQVVAIFKKTP